jgi:hypothetical protein
MSLKSIIMDGAKGTGQFAGVTPVGELFVAGFGVESNQSVFRSLDTVGSFNFFGPIAGQQFMITSMIFSGISGKIITVYEASSPSTTTIDRTVFKIHLRNDSTIHVPLQFGGYLAVSEGEYLNALVDTALPATNVSIIGYYQPMTHDP